MLQVQLRVRSVEEEEYMPEAMLQIKFRSEKGEGVTDAASIGEEDAWGGKIDLSLIKPQSDVLFLLSIRIHAVNFYDWRTLREIRSHDNRYCHQLSNILYLVARRSRTQALESGQILRLR